MARGRSSDIRRELRKVIPESVVNEWARETGAAQPSVSGRSGSTTWSGCSSSESRVAGSARWPGCGAGTSG